MLGFFQGQRAAQGRRVDQAVGRLVRSGQQQADHLRGRRNLLRVPGGGHGPAA